MKSNISDLGNHVSHTVQIGGEWFIREALVKLVDKYIQDFVDFTDKNGIITLPEFNRELQNLKELVNTETTITEKQLNIRLLFGADATLEQKAMKWKDELLGI